jgi:hypothetical protein
LGVLALIAFSLRRAKPDVLEGQTGIIAPDKVTAWLTITVGIAMIVAGTVGLFLGAGLAAVVIVPMGGLIAGFMAPSITRVHAVQWTSSSVVGPSRLFGPTLGTSRTEIAWSELTRTGKTATGYWYVEARDGQRIYWSFLYRGHGAFADALSFHCPRLQLPQR